MRLFTVSSIDSSVMVKGPKGTNVPNLGKNGGPLCVTDGMISSKENCEAFRARKLLTAESVSGIKKWRR